jgi:hypothetical protein
MVERNDSPAPVIQSLTVEQLIGTTPANPDRGVPGLTYQLVTLNGDPQRYLAIVADEGSKVMLIEVEDADEAGEEMMRYWANKLGLSPQ